MDRHFCMLLESLAILTFSGNLPSENDELHRCRPEEQQVDQLIPSVW